MPLKAVRNREFSAKRQGNSRWLSVTSALTLTLLPFAVAAQEQDAVVVEEKKLLWGDTHLHTSYSFDAFLNDNLRADPATAFRFAMGAPVEHPYHNARVQLDRPLDFLAVSDHAEFLGIIGELYREGPNLDGLSPWDKIKFQVATAWIRRKIDQQRGRDLFAPALPVPQEPRVAAQDLVASATGVPDDTGELTLPPQPEVELGTWRKITEIAESYYRPGEFTTLLAWEWSSIPGGGNLHRVVVSDANAEQAQSFEPFGFDDSPYPDDLWSFLERTEESTGARFIAIPHNSNISKGVMFDARSLRDEEIDAEYATLRMRWEPIAEVTQIKGDSETHPLLSPDDEFADFETYPYYIQRDLQKYIPQVGDYLRSALKLGLEIEQKQGVNPFQLGLIGSTDAHTGLSSADEYNFHGKMATDSIPANKASGFGRQGGTSGWAMSASGLAAVWASENTREAIIDAMKRREVYATSGPRISLRFTALPSDFEPSAPYTDLAEEGASADQLSLAIARGAPMGSVISGPAGPRFYVEALSDPLSAFLDRIQIVKGWVGADGVSQEKVYDVALSDPSRRLANGGVAPIEDTVDRQTGMVDNRVGAAMLSAVWTDPEFDAAAASFYYARVLEIPTARHSFLDALALGLETAAGQPDTIQERAYSSPIWFKPE
ncbi:MAG: DUF3604 domain-containing protein [Pseudomonadota bacterium]